jgi:alkanesulfonate monooxygenase SsuD/methylene tetrahydromethanopterin reductase-like flavin-dependent oxidoreductase (luciferase family)
VSHAQVIRNVVDEAVLAEQSGLDVFGIGEHHRDDFAISSPEMVLAGIATRTERLRLASAVTVLSSDDPVEGTLTQSLHGVAVFPPVENAPLPTWVAVGGSPESVIRAARHGLDLMLAIIGGPVDRFAPFVELYHRALEQLEQPTGRVGFHSFGHVAATDEEAVELYGSRVAPLVRDMLA